MSSILKYLKNILTPQSILKVEEELTGIDKADALLKQLIRDKKVPGLSITVIKEGETIFQKGYGFANLVDNTPVDPLSTIFRIASVSKPIAATALAIAVQDGLIDLDTSFYTYVPYYPKKKWNFTIRQLASHTAGVRAYRGKEYGLNKAYGIKDSLVVFQDDDLLFEPGKGYLYNSFDWVLISLAIQEASGIPFEQYVQEKVLNPLGLKSTFAPEKSANTEQNKNPEDIEKGVSIATYYSKKATGFRTAIPVNNFYKLGAGGYLSTSEDIAQFGQSYLDEKLLAVAASLPFLTAQEVDGKSTYYGLGWQVSEDAKGRQFYGHVGNGVGGYSNFFVYPQEQMVFSILINCTDPKVQEELDEVIAIFLSQTEKGYLS